MNKASTTDRVFLSYASNEAPYVRRVIAELERRGVETWYDARGLVPGSQQEEAIGEALASAKLVIFFLSTSSIDSPWLNFEIGAAIGSSRQVIPVFLSEAAARRAPAVLSAVHGIDARALKPEDVAERIAEVAEAT